MKLGTITKNIHESVEFQTLAIGDLFYLSDDVERLGKPMYMKGDLAEEIPNAVRLNPEPGLKGSFITFKVDAKVWMAKANIIEYI